MELKEKKSTNMGSLALPKPPIIDFTNKDMQHGTSIWCTTRKHVQHALEEYGFFIALYDKISPELHDAIVHAAKEVFDLPFETKTLISSDKPYHGYFGHLPTRPLVQGIGMADSTSLLSAQSFTNSLWPSGNEAFCESAYSFARIVSELDHMVTRMLFESYGAEKYYESHIESKTYLLRLLKYRAPKYDEAKMAIPSHTDKSFFTILHQNQVDGLCVKTKDGNWIRVEFLPSSFVVMAGDACMGWTNDRVCSPHHRVIMDRDDQARYSIALFSFVSKLIEAPPELIDDEHPLRYKPFDQVELHKFYHTEEGHRAENTVLAFCGI